MNLLESIRNALTIQGTLLNVTIGDLQTDKDSCVSLFQHNGNQQRYFGGAKLNSQIIRIVIRDAEYARGLQTIDKIKNVLNDYSDEFIKGTYLKNQDSYLGKDDKRRNVWDITYLITY